MPQVDKVHFFPVLVWVIMLFLIWYMMVIVNIIPKYYKVFSMSASKGNLLYKDKKMNSDYNKKKIKNSKVMKSFYSMSNMNLGSFDMMKQNIKNKTMNMSSNNMMQSTSKSYMMKYMTENYWNMKNQFYMNMLSNYNNKVWLLNFNNKSLEKTEYYKELLGKKSMDKSCFEKVTMHPMCTWVQQLSENMYCMMGWNMTHNKNEMMKNNKGDMMKFNKLYSKGNMKEVGDIWLMKKSEMRNKGLVNNKDYLMDNEEMKEGMMKYYENLMKKGEMKTMYSAMDGENSEMLLVMNNNDKAMEMLQMAKMKESEEWVNFMNWGGNNNLMMTKELKEEMMETMNSMKKD